MTLEVLDLNNKIIKTVDDDVFCISRIRYDLIHKLVVWQRSKNRRAISHKKEISDVRGSTRKIYKQKGTGRARHGSIRGAQFVGGGIIFGPTKDRKYTYKINKKVKKIALINALALKYKEKSISVYEQLKVEDNKSRSFLSKHISNFSLKKVLLVDTVFDTNLVLSVRNFNNFNRLKVVGLNVLDIMKHSRIYFSEQAFNYIRDKIKL